MSAVIGAHASAIATDTVNPATTTGVTTQATGSSFFIFVGFQGATAPTIPNDSKGNVYTQVGSTVLYSDSSGGSAVFKCENGVGGSGHTASASLSGMFKLIAFCEVKGGVLSGIVDQTPAGNDDTSSPYTSNSTGTTAQADELLLSWAVPADNDGTETRAWSNSFSEFEGQNDAHVGFTGGLASRSVTSIGSYQSSLTITSTIGPVTECIVFLISLKSLVTPSASTWIQPPLQPMAIPLAGLGMRALAPADKILLGRGLLATGPAKASNAGTGAGTQSGLTASGSGAESLPGTGSGMQASLLASGAGAESLPGTVAGVQPGLVTSGAGVEALSGTGAGALADLAASGTGTESLPGTGAGVQPGLDAAGSGAESFDGAGAGVEPGLVAAGAGAESMPGTGAGVQPGLTSSGPGSESMDGSGAGAQPGLDAAAAGAESTAGTGAGAQPGLVAQAEPPNVNDGSGAGIVAPLTAAGAGAESQAGTGAGVEPGLVGASEAALVGAGAAVLATEQGAGVGGIGNAGAGQAAQPGLAAAASGSEQLVGSGAGVQAPLVAQASDDRVPVDGDAAAVLAPDVGSGAGAIENAGLASAAVVIEAQAFEAIGGSGAATLAPLVGQSFIVPAWLVASLPIHVVGTQMQTAPAIVG